MDALEVNLHHDASEPRRIDRALADVRGGLQRWRLAWQLAVLDLRNRYRGSVLGPFWMTLSMAVMVAGLGVLYSQLFRLDLATYLPHLAVSLVVWTWIAASLNESCAAFTGAEGIIRQLPMPYTVHVLRCVLRNAITAAHALPIPLVVLWYVDALPGPEGLLALVGLVIVMLNVAALAYFLGMICARFRDVPQIVSNVVQLAFFVTPVIWKAELLGDDAAWLVLNPFYGLLETVRGPLVEGGGPWPAWGAALVVTAVNVSLAAATFVRFRARIAFWV